LLPALPHLEPSPLASSRLTTFPPSHPRVKPVRRVRKLSFACSLAPPSSQTASKHPPQRRKLWALCSPRLRHNTAATAREVLGLASLGRGFGVYLSLPFCAFAFFDGNLRCRQSVLAGLSVIFPP
jgi:hypothetical protein